MSQRTRQLEDAVHAKNRFIAITSHVRHNGPPLAGAYVFVT